MADDSLTFCDSDEEVFFGKVTEKELRKRVLLGVNFDSPACSTPRPKPVSLHKKIVSNLPDVLSSSSKQNNMFKPDESSICLEKNQGQDFDTSKNLMTANISLDDDVIIIENSDNDSVQIISDDESFLKNRDSFSDVESFLRNEELCKSTNFDDSMSSKTNDSLYANILPPETSELDYGSFFSNKEKTNSETITLDSDNFHTQTDFEMKNVSENVNSKSDISSSAMYKSISENTDCKNSNLSSTGILEAKAMEAENSVLLDIFPKKSDISSSATFESISEQTDCKHSIVANKIPETEAMRESVAEHSLVSNNFTNKSDISSSETYASISGESNMFIEKDQGKSLNLSIQTDQEFNSENGCVSDNFNRISDISSSATFASVSSEFSIIQEKVVNEYSNMSLSNQIPELKAIEEFLVESSQKNEQFSDLTSSNACYSPSSFKYGDQTNNLKISTADHGSFEESTKAGVENSTSEHIFANAPVHNLTVAENQLAQRSGLSDLDYSSLYAVSDSILNISHGSSLPSPLSQENKDSPRVLPNVLYEDISCDDEQSLNRNGQNSSAPPEIIVEENEEFHMSVDETDFLYNSSIGNTGTAESSYCTAFDAGSHQSSTMFTKYRDTLNDSQSIDVNNELNLMETEGENIKEISFENVMQNRQNSFAAEQTVHKNENIPDKNKTVSKLPVFKSGVSLIKPPKLNVKPDNLVSSNFKWAKHLPKLDDKKKHDQSKIAFTSKIPSTTSGNHILHNAQGESRTNIKKPTTPMSGISKTPAKTTHALQVPQRVMKSGSKTPVSTLPVPQVRVVKSQSNTPNVKPLVKNTLSHDKGNVKTPSLLAPVRDRYKNIISPVRSYITGAPCVLQEKAQLPREGQKSSSKKKPHTYIPVAPLKENETNLMKVPKIVQKLNYGQAAGQENLDPDHTRDTLPPRTLVAASALFIKEEEKTKRILPKVGETMQKLMDTPRPKIIVHEGRVRQSPNVKGRLIANKDSNTSHDDSYTSSSVADISVRLIKSTEEK